MAPSHFILVLCTRFGVLEWFDQKRKTPVVRDDDNHTADLVQVRNTSFLSTTVVNTLGRALSGVLNPILHVFLRDSVLCCYDKTPRSSANIRGFTLLRMCIVFGTTRMATILAIFHFRFCTHS